MEAVELAIAGVAFRVTTSRPEVVAALRAAWRPSLRSTLVDADEIFVGARDEIRLNGESWNGALDVHDAAPRVERLLFERIFERYPDAPAIHAGAVRLFDTLVLLVGVSGAGKSSVTREMLRLGADYLSDDLVLLDGRVVRGISRSVQFDPVPLSEGVPEYFLDCDVASYVTGLDREKAVKIPLWLGEFHTLPELGLESLRSVFVVRIEKGERDSLVPASDLKRAVELHAASLVTARNYGGELGAGPTSVGTWRTPGGLARLIFEVLQAEAIP